MWSGLDCKGKRKSERNVVSRIGELRQVTAHEVEPIDLISAQEEDSDIATVKEWVSKT